MAGKHYNVLFLCTGNAARSIMAECLLRFWAGDRFNTYSAGLNPHDQIHPYTMDLLKQINIPLDNCYAKSWETLKSTNPPQMDFIFTVSDTAAGEDVPFTDGQPITANWPFPDPKKVEGTEAERRAAFADVFRMIERRIKVFCALPDYKLDKLTPHELESIHEGNNQQQLSA